MDVFTRLESNVRGYCRTYPRVFDKARGAMMYDEAGRGWIDFLAGAGSLNYGHNDSAIQEALLEYLSRDGVLHGLDLHTVAKRRFLEVFERRVLWPLELDVKVQFTGPTGTNAVEAALKLARNATGRTNVISFTNGFHGVSLGSVAATANDHFRNAAGVPLSHVTFMPYDGYCGDGFDTLDYFEQLLTDSSSGVDRPAAVLVETVQGEGGVNVASVEWIRRLRGLCDEHDILMIVDDIQVGCGRTGSFFSFEEAAIVPDIITLSKSLSASGLPMSLVLMRSDLDRWKPGEHNGTFRGNNLAFVSATRALEVYWSDTRFSEEIRAKGRFVKERLEAIAERYAEIGLEVRGRGLIWGLDGRACPALAGAVSQEAFRRGLIIETSGTDGRVLKLLPPLTIERDVLERGLDVIEESYEAVLRDESFVEQHELAELQAG